MALLGTEKIRVVGLINGQAAAKEEDVTTQQIANLANGGSSALKGSEVVSIRGVAANGSGSSNFFNTTTGSIAALGSIAPSTLKGTEIVLIGPLAGPAGSPTGAYLQTTTQQIANS